MSSPKAPQELIDLQDWFSKAVTTQSKDEQEQNQSDAEKFIKSSGDLASQERLSVYMSDFWPRCLGSLSDDFSLLKKLLGPTDFNGLMKAYLAAYPSSSHTLFDLPQYFIRYLNESYHNDNRDLVIDLANYEWAHCKAAITKESPSFNPELLSDDDKAGILTLSFTLQDHVQLIHRQYSLNYSNKNIENISDTETFVIIYRENYKVIEEEVPKQLYALLSNINEGKSIIDSLETITQTLNKDDTLYVESNIQTWFAFCVQKGLFTQPKKGEKI